MHLWTVMVGLSRQSRVASLQSKSCDVSVAIDGSRRVGGIRAKDDVVVLGGAVLAEANLVDRMELGAVLERGGIGWAKREESGGRVSPQSELHPI